MLLSRYISANGWKNTEFSDTPGLAVDPVVAGSSPVGVAQRISKPDKSFCSFCHLPAFGSAAFPNGQERYVPFLARSMGDLHMPWSKDHIPKYRKHRASGQALVTINGRGLYLGPHGTKASKVEYDRLVCEWLA
jgi:hypothetical protein